MQIDPNWQADQIILNRIDLGLFVVAMLLLGFTADGFRRRQSGRPNSYWVLLCCTLGLLVYGIMFAVMASAIQQPHKPVLLLRSLQAVGTLAWIEAIAIIYRNLWRQRLEEQRKQC